MGGMHFTVIGAVVVTAIAYWIIGHGAAAGTVGTGLGSNVGKLGRAFTASPPATGT